MRNAFLFTSVLGLLFPFAAAGQQPINFTPRTFTVDQTSIDVEMGTFEVPSDHTNPASTPFTLAVARLKSTASSPAAPIVYLAGGPGGSGIGAGRIPYMLSMLQKLRKVADVILLDQRGTGMSQPRPVCEAKSGAPADIFTSEARAAEAYGEFVRSCVAEWRPRGVDPVVFNSEQSADDLGALRSALGVEKISLLGFSYGTHLALAAIRRHGAQLERVALAGVEGPDHNWKLPATIERQLDTLSALVAADSAMHRLLPDFTGAVRAVLARVDEKPWVVRIRSAATQDSIDLPIGGYGMRYLIVRDLGDTNDLPNYPGWIWNMTRGDARYLTRLAERRYNETRGLNLMSVATDCASSVSTARRQRVLAEAPTTTLGNAANIFFEQRCEAVGVPPLSDEFRSPIRSDVPTLFISGTLDSQTPPFQAEEVRRGFVHGVHIVVENAGHESTLPSEEVQRLMAAFFAGEEVRDQTVELPSLRFVVPR